MSDCIFCKIINGDFGTEGAVTIQNNVDVNFTVNVTGCTFNDIPNTSHEIFVIYPFKNWTLNTDVDNNKIHWENRK